MRTKGSKNCSEAIISEVLKQKSEGKTHREISEYFGFPTKENIKMFIKRYNNKQRLIASGIKQT